MVDPLVDGALDNTLGQSAYGWFKNPIDPLLDRQAPAAFRDFVDAYVHVRSRHVPLPHGTTTDNRVHEPFITLWQEGATHITHAAPLEAQIERSALWERFQHSVRVDPVSWSKWIRFQWTPAIVPAFMTRVPDWKEQLRAALEEVGPAAEKVDGSIQRLVKYLQSDFDEGSLNLDHEYRAFASEARTTIEVVACAYGWNWFCRGASYRGRTHGMSVRFHDLRECAVVSPNDVISKPCDLPVSLSWGHILASCIEKELIKRDSQYFCEALKKIRDTVQGDPEYKNHLVESESAVTVEGRDNHLKSAAARALIRTGTPPLFREATFRGQLRDGVIEFASHTSGLGAPLGKIVYQTVDLFIGNKARASEYWVRERFAQSSLWKVFTIPGMD